jgi:hypothetical protein
MGEPEEQRLTLHTGQVILAGFALLRLEDLRTVELGSVDTRVYRY